MGSGLAAGVDRSSGMSCNMSPATPFLPSDAGSVLLDEGDPQLHPWRGADPPVRQIPAPHAGGGILPDQAKQPTQLLCKSFFWLHVSALTFFPPLLFHSEPVVLPLSFPSLTGRLAVLSDIRGHFKSVSRRLWL